MTEYRAVLTLEPPYFLVCQWPQATTMQCSAVKHLTFVDHKIWEFPAIGGICVRAAKFKHYTVFMFLPF